MTLSGETRQPYPATNWERVAERQGDMVAVFGRTKEELLLKKELSH